METTIWGKWLYKDNGKENGNYYLHRERRKEKVSRSCCRAWGKVMGLVDKKCMNGRETCKPIYYWDLQKSLPAIGKPRPHTQRFTISCEG